MTVLYVRIPEDRVGVAIGPGGRTKRSVELETGAQVEIGTEDGEVRVSVPDDQDPTPALKARDLLWAIGRGFSPERARRLLKEGTYLAVIDIKQVSRKKGKSALWRVRSRLIGTEGRARTRLEELSGCSMSVYGSTVALIGTETQLDRATRAIELLLRGSEHTTVFHMLAGLRRTDARNAAVSPATVDEPPE